MFSSFSNYYYCNHNYYFSSTCHYVSSSNKTIHLIVQLIETIEWICFDDFIVYLYLYCQEGEGWKFHYRFNPTAFLYCSMSGSGFPTPYVIFLCSLVWNERWLFRYVDVCGIVYHRCLNLLFIIPYIVLKILLFIHWQ